MNIVSVCEKPQVIKFRPQEECAPVPAIIKVISAGGGGANALNRIIGTGHSEVQYFAVNTDIQDLYNKSKAKTKVQIGAKLTGGRGAGGKPEVGEKAAMEDREKIMEMLSGADMIFITACMGGGTGTGSAPVIAEIAKELGILTVAVVTTPFDFEGRYKMKIAKAGIDKLRPVVDTLIVIPNQYLFKIVDCNTSLDDAYLIADEVLCRGVLAISDLITKTGFKNTDFADVETIMRGQGDALMGIGSGSGGSRAKDAVAQAIDNPLLEDTSLDGATGILVNIAGPKGITLVEIEEMIKTIKEKCDPEVNIIHGVRIDPELDNSIHITVIATGFKSTRAAQSNLPCEKKKEPDFINFEEYVKIRERTKNPPYLSYLPQREYQDDLDFPSVLRNHDYKAEEKKESGSDKYFKEKAE
ncbi:MAG: cell division protein FtsZ [Treponema sp.]|jgi:cell division protein FtsZ|nr:cell division protein FtsZ [Treponema sp.]